MVAFWCERLEERHALVFFLTIHMGWGGVGLYSTFLQLAHAGDAHAMNATVLMGWRGVGLCSCSTCTCWWCTRRECYGTHGLLWGGAVFMFLQLAHAGDAHAMKATLRYSWVVVGRGCVHVPSTCTRWWCTRHECYGTHGVVWGGGGWC